jgi:hypothetical protein
LADRLKPISRRLPPPIARPLRAMVPRAWLGPAPLVIPPRRPSTPRPKSLEIVPSVPGRLPLAVWPEEPPPGYLGQLDPAFQRQLADRWAEVALEDCYFYHCVRLPDGSFVEGPWDLLDNEHEYLGGIDFDGRRVIEFGPASGWLTVWMSQNGADVVALDLGWDLACDVMPLSTIDVEKARAESVSFATQVESAWWYLRRAYGHSAKAVYAPIYDLPRDLGRYDVAVFGAILIHLRDPFRALEQAAALTDDTIVVVEPMNLPMSDADKPILLWNPSHGTNWTGWWYLSPGVITDMLGVLGFPNSTVSYHRQFYKPPLVPDAVPTEVVVYTVVARRH